MKTWVEDLIKEYSIGKNELEKYREALNLDIPSDREEDKIIGEMISDMKYAIDWMNKGRRPGNRRGYDRRSVYQRTALMEMDIFPALDICPSKKYLSEEDKIKLVDILVELSSRERECYLLHMTRGMSYAQIATELGLSRRTIQQYVERAKNKIKILVS